MSSPDDTNPGGPIDQTPEQMAQRRIEMKLDRIANVVTLTYEEVVALRPRVATLETR